MPLSTALLKPPSTAKLLPFIESYLEARPAFYAFIRPQEAYLFQSFLPKIKPPILDFGCGDGFFAGLIFPQKGIDVGLDIQNSRIDQAAYSNCYRQLKIYDGVVIPFPDNSFQTIISNCVFEHLSALKDNLQEMFRILKPGGLLITTVMTDYWEQDLIGVRFLGGGYRRYLRETQNHLNLYKPKAWDQEFTQAGFHIKNCYGYLHPRAAHADEITHFLSTPSLVSHRLLGRWVIFPHWYRPFRLSEIIARQIQPDINQSRTYASALFYVLQKGRHISRQFTLR